MREMTSPLAILELKRHKCRAPLASKPGNSILRFAIKHATLFFQFVPPPLRVKFFA